jgi:hypothetical protein
MLFAWYSLVWVAFTDLYVYLLSTEGGERLEYLVRRA